MQLITTLSSFFFCFTLPFFFFLKGKQIVYTESLGQQVDMLKYKIIIITQQGVKMKYVNKQTQNKHKWCVAFYKSAENAESWNILSAVQ